MLDLYLILLRDNMNSDVWMQDSPFTNEEKEAYNRYTHFPADINKRFKEMVLAEETCIKNRLAEYGIDKPTDRLTTAVYYYRKAVYHYFLEEIRARTMAPPAYVVGPAKYQTHKLPKAEKIREKSLYPIKLAEKYIERGINEAIKGKPAVATIQKWLPLVKSAKNRLAFGKQYVEEKKRELRAKPESELTGYDHMLLSGNFDHVLRSEGRAIYDKLIGYIEIRPKQLQPTLTGEAALLAQRIKKPETKDKRPAKKKYVEPEPYQVQLGDSKYQTTLGIVGVLSLMYLLKKRRESQWIER